MFGSDEVRRAPGMMAGLSVDTKMWAQGIKKVHGRSIDAFVCRHCGLDCPSRNALHKHIKTCAHAETEIEGEFGHCPAMPDSPPRHFVLRGRAGQGASASCPRLPRLRRKRFHPNLASSSGLHQSPSILMLPLRLLSAMVQDASETRHGRSTRSQASLRC